MALAVALGLALGASGCGLFETAEPENPLTSGGAPPNLTDPESTLVTLERAIHDRNDINFGLVFADTFLVGRDFHVAFDPADTSEWVAEGRFVPTDWNRELEVRFFPRFLAINPAARYDVVFFPDTLRGDPPRTSTKVILNRIYRVRALGVPVVAGSAGLTFEFFNPDWKLTFWEDRRDTANVQTWGRARLEGFTNL